LWFLDIMVLKPRRKPFEYAPSSVGIKLLFDCERLFPFHYGGTGLHETVAMSSGPTLRGLVHYSAAIIEVW
jgi:hypothetical protein